MFKNLSPGRLAGAWCAAAVAVGAGIVWAGGALTVGNGELWLIACAVPSMVILLVWRGAPPLTVAELLREVGVPPSDARP